MPGIGNNLYPPIIDTYMPAFPREEACRIYFSLSNYNSVEDISNVQVIISNQNTNLSALSMALYPAGIKITNLSVDNSIQGSDKYYVIIYPGDLDGGIFELNQFYKVQIRFTGKGAAAVPNMRQIASWLTNNQGFFSEWSTVTLIKGIEKPNVYLKGFEDTLGSSDQLVFMSEIVDLVGSMYFDKNEEIEKEYLKFYNAKIYKSKNNILVFNSGDIYTNIYNPNEINYTLPFGLEDGVEYRLDFSYTTINEYTSKKSYTFSIIQNTIDVLKATITAEPDIENGRVKIEIKSTLSEPFFGNLTIRRTSSKSNFTVWEDIHQSTVVEGTMLDYIWYDYTIESGIFYRYCAQQRNSKGDRGAVINIRYPIMIELEDIFLTRAGMQFKVKFNPTISSFKTTYIESKTDTIGSKYPFIRRNGNVKYRQFPISGLITAFCDEEGTFLSKNVIYGEAAQNYQDYNGNLSTASDNNITEYNDYIYERFFREKIMEFLYEDNIKLFRSNTEGNILIRLMDINFTPNQTLGRMIYSFSATAYEMDECSLANYERYNIQTVGTYSMNLEYRYTKIGQVIKTFSPSDNLFSILVEKYRNSTLDKYVNTVEYIHWLRIEFNSDPYLIKVVGGIPQILSASDRPDKNTIQGYIVNINNKPIVVSPRRFYELIDEDIIVTSVSFPVEVDVTIDYMAQLVQRENRNLLYSKMYFNTNVGQIRDFFDINDSAFRAIYLKYLYDYQAYHQQLMSLDEITIEADPGTVVYIKDSFDEDYFKHEIGKTGTLKFRDEDAIITGIYFDGMQLYPGIDKEEKIITIEDNKIIRPVKKDAMKVEAEDTEGLVLNTYYFKVVGNTIVIKSKEVSKDHEYIDNGDSVGDFYHILTPLKNRVYYINGERYIYYREEWYKFSDDDRVQCPTEAIIDYIYETMKGEY